VLRFHFRPLPQVLITKLRSANTAETRQYRKASKALLVLIPLFGLTYLIVLYGPNEGIGKKIFDIARALLLSTQVCSRRLINRVEHFNRKTKHLLSAFQLKSSQ
jgi:7 transmembrane receptor (Secretin family)